MDDKFVKLPVLNSYYYSDDFGPLLEAKYKKTENPFYAVEAFLWYKRFGLEQPSWVMEYLYQGFEGYYRSPGPGRLEKLLGFNTGKTGGTPPFKDKALERRNNLIFLHVYLLENLIDLTLDKAAYLVNDMQKTHSYNASCLFIECNGYKLKQLGYENIKKEYSKSRKSGFVDNLNKIGFVEQNLSFVKALFLSAFLPTQAIDDNQVTNMIKVFLYSSIRGTDSDIDGSQDNFVNEYLRILVKGYNPFNEKQFVSSFDFHHYLLALSYVAFREPTILKDILF